jgi:hypothetical protein
MAVIVAALIVPQLAGVRIAGNAVAATVAPAPTVGDCLLRTPSNPVNDPVPGVARDAPLLTVQCSLPHDAQVISLTQDRDQFPAVHRDSSARYPNIDACSDLAYPFLGVRALNEAGDRSGLLGPWLPASIGTFVFLSPDPTQRRVGQRWLACLLISPQGLVTGSSAGVFVAPARSNPLAVCHKGANVLLDVSISCQRPHAMELLGWRVADESVSGQRPLDQSCAELVRRMTGMSDPTAGGELLVAAVVMHFDGNGVLSAGYGPGPHSEWNRAACTVSRTGSRLLAGSLTGLGDAPVPWA